MSWHGYFGDAGGYDWWSGQNHLLSGVGSHGLGSHQNSMANAQYNQYNSQCSGLYQQQFRPVAPAVTERKADCEGCGAPLKAYIHHCEYCRRST